MKVETPCPPRFSDPDAVGASPGPALPGQPAGIHSEKISWIFVLLFSWMSLQQVEFILSMVYH